MENQFTKRKQLRLPEYDYGLCNVYFVTICTKDRKPLFWTVGASIARPPQVLSPIGRIACEAIRKISSIYPAVRIDQFCIMPEHIHLLLSINADSDGRAMLAPTVSRVVQQMKGAVTKAAGVSIWQRSYYDHVVRNDEDYLACWQYIENNPKKRLVTSNVCR